MDRDSISQTVALLVVVLACVRWLPASGTEDWLGRGAPRAALKLDAMFASGERPLQTAMALRAGFAPLRVQRYLAWAQLVRQIEERGEPGSRIQLKGVSRNEGWLLAYDLYPHRVVGETAENGSSAADETRPDVFAVLIGGDVPRLEWPAP